MNGKLTSIIRAAAYGLILISVVLFPQSLQGNNNLSHANSLFCACCADDGEWYQSSESITADMRKEINRVKFSEVTELSRGEQDAGSLPEGKFELAQSKDMRHWQLKFSGSQGKTGTLSLPIPLRLVSFGADVHDGQQGGGGGPLLYKEWRFDGAVSGTGVFKNWRRNARFRMVLQGRGNHCTQAEDFKNWNLSVNQGSKSLSFYGAVVR